MKSMTRKYWKVFLQEGGANALDSKVYPTVRAFADGKIVRCNGVICANCLTCSSHPDSYTIEEPTPPEPKPTHRPYKSANECLRDLKGEPVVYKPDGSVCMLTARPASKDSDYIYFCGASLGGKMEADKYSLEDTFTSYTKLDGSPCGMPVEDDDDEDDLMKED